MHVVSLTIGRNIGDTPMDYQRWQQFQTKIAALLIQAQPDATIEQHHGTGSWEGVVEQSTKVTALCDHQMSQDGLDLIQAKASYIASQYQQDAVALTIGWSSLIPALTPAQARVANLTEHQYQEA